YLMAHPPRSFSLRFAGEALPGFLAGPVAEAFAARWPFAADLAALEWALVDVFDAPDAELLTRDALTRLAPEDWAGLRFSLVPAQRVLARGWPVARLREAWSAGEGMPELAPRATRVLVYRSGESAAFRALDTAEAHALERLAAGADFAALCAGVAEEAGDTR